MRDAKCLLQRNDSRLAFFNERHAAVESVDVFLVVLSRPRVCRGEELARWREVKHIDVRWFAAELNKVRNCLFKEMGAWKIILIGLLDPWRLVNGVFDVKSGPKSTARHASGTTKRVEDGVYPEL